MKLELAAWLLLAAACVMHPTADAFAPPSPPRHAITTARRTSAAAASVQQEASSSGLEKVASMSFRELQHECKELGLDSSGTTGKLRNRLRIYHRDESCDPVTEICEDNQDDKRLAAVLDFVDQSDPDFEFKELVAEAQGKASQGHWKAATRKLKRLGRLYPDKKVPEELYVSTLEACMADRLHGARAAEPARKILEQLVDEGYGIPPEAGNHCVQNCLGDGPNGTHEGFGGIDTAFAMVAALESSQVPLSVETYGKVAATLAKNGELDEALAYLRSIVVDRSLTPSLEVFAKVASAAEQTEPEKVMTVLAYAKAAGYELDSVASTQDGRSLLASGVIAAEKMDNLPLGLRLLTAASKASGCAPDRGDDLVASSSSAAQRASTLIHKRAINEAAVEGNWRLCVKLLEAMTARSLKPSPWVWRNVITCCAKAEKSRKATALLLDWVKLSEKGEIEKPPLSVFNTVVNACEICDEQELTLVVLDAMKKTEDSEGNIITFNIALKRLARQGNKFGCEGIIIGMLQQGVEPSVVSYTTAIAACVSSEPKDPKYAYEWIKRMRSRNVMPNVLTYNTALAACLDGKLESTMLGSSLASEMVKDVERQVQLGETQEGTGDAASVYTNVLPDSYTKALARQLMQQLRDNWRSGDINMQVAKATVRVPLLKLVDFQKSDAAQALKLQTEKSKEERVKEEDQVEVTTEKEEELEYASTARFHRAAEV